MSEMTDSGIPIRRQPARFLVGEARRGQGILLLYPDKLAAVTSPAPAWGRFVGPIAVVAVAFPLVHGYIGALGVFVGGLAGGWIGDVIGKSLAAKKVAANGDGVTRIPLDSITSLQTRRPARISAWLWAQTLLVTTTDGAEYGFRGKMERWQADLASALTVRGSEVRATPQGMTVTPRATREEDLRRDRLRLVPVEESLLTSGPAGHSAGEAEALASMCPGWQQAPSAAIDIFALASARLYDEIARNDPQPFKQTPSDAARDWARYRRALQLCQRWTVPRSGGTSSP